MHPRGSVLLDHKAVALGLGARGLSRRFRCPLKMAFLTVVRKRNIGHNMKLSDLARSLWVGLHDTAAAVQSAQELGGPPVDIVVEDPPAQASHSPRCLLLRRTHRRNDPG